MKKRQAAETALGVRLVYPHSPFCLYSRRPETIRGRSTFFLTGEQVYRSRDGRKTRAALTRWFKLTCLADEKCEALALVRADRIEEIVENTIRQMKAKKS